MVIVLFLVLYYTFWVEDLFARLNIEFPCIFGKQKAYIQEPNSNETKVMRVNSAPKTIQRSKTFRNLHKNSNKYPLSSNRPTQSIKLPEEIIANYKHEMKNDLDYSYIDHFKESNHGTTRSDETDNTDETSIIEATLEDITPKAIHYAPTRRIFNTSHSPMGDYLEIVLL